MLDQLDTQIQEQNLENSQQLFKNVANIISVHLLAAATKREQTVNELVNIDSILELAQLFTDQKISNQGLQKALDKLLENPEQKVQEIIESEGLLQISDDTSLEAFVDVVIENNPEPVQQYKDGKTQVIGFLIGQCMKESQGKGNPQKFREIIVRKLSG
jgi:aspartyl-tRNA(Asn)/glutamyl-tRNA(Gln) amidotransferase subunit B